MPQPEFELKERLRVRGISVLGISESLKMPYSTLNCQLNGFSPLLPEVRKAIEQIIHERDAELAGIGGESR